MGLCVCVCVCVCQTCQSSTKTAKHRITQTTPHASPGTLVFRHQRSPRNSTGVTPDGRPRSRSVGRNDRLGCFVDRLDRLRRLVDDFTTRLDLVDFQSTWSTCGHFDHNFLLVLAHWQLTRKILCPST